MKYLKFKLKTLPKKKYPQLNEKIFIQKIIIRMRQDGMQN